MSRDENTVCAHCDHFKMKDYPDHARVGIGRCVGYDGKHEQLINPFLPWRTKACGRYRRAKDMAVRVAWMEKQSTKSLAVTNLRESA